MKKVLLYYPKTAEAGRDSDLYIGLPISVLSLAAQIDENVYDICVIDARVDSIYGNLELERWISEGLLLVGISAMTSYQIYDGLRFAKWLREEQHISTLIAWGGWHASLMPMQTIKHPLVDMLIIGQGEVTFLQVLSAISYGQGLHNISNLVLKDEAGSIFFTEQRSNVDITSCTSITHAAKYIDFKRYLNKIWGHSRVLGYESSRGCPWHCKYCSVGAVYKSKWSSLSAETMLSDISYFITNYSIDAIHFYDNNFFVNQKRVVEFCNAIKEDKLVFAWDGTCTVEQFLSFTDDFILMMKDCGFYRVIAGVESGDMDVLERIGKKHTPDMVIEMVHRCKKHGLMVSMSFMVGFPWNPEKDFFETVNLIEKIRRIYENTEILLFIFTPYCGTDLYQIACDYNMEFPKTLEGWAEYTYERVNTPWISKKLRHRMERYISFFGTKPMSDSLIRFYKGYIDESSRRNCIE